WNGANFPSDVGPFDRVLADVPCSCEGTTRKNPEILWREPIRTDDYSGAQAAILRKAVQRCQPGGRVVYATCTYAPEENEGVIDTVLDEYPDGVRLLPAHLDGLVSSPGLTEWQGRRFRPELADTLRVWPHQNDTGGFFVAVLERLDDATP
ncbi:MAG: RNA methyltransferase, partial [Acidobacteriota bacterium]